MANTILQSKPAVPSRVKFTKPTNSTLHHEPATNTAAVCSLSGSDTDAGQAWVLRGLQYCYDLTPTGGSLTISDGTDTWKYDVPNPGEKEIIFDPPFLFVADTTVTITLAAGGSGVSGTLNARNSWIEPSQY